MQPPPKKRPLRRIFRLCQWLLLFGLIIGGGSNCWILEHSRRRIFTDIAAVPQNEVGLVLGTSNSTPGGFSNPFFNGRIAAAADLYHAGKVHHLLLSGDNHTRGYDEPNDMKNALLAKGVPESVLTLDDAGFRTLDSMARARSVFGLSRLTIITDDFHAPRSVVLAQHFEIDAIAFCPSPVPLKWSIRTRVRELLARVKTVLDLTVRTQPHFLGPSEKIN